jgi:hypothetical protein
MSRLGREIIWTAILVAGGMFLFPPVGTIETYGRSSPRGYAFLFSNLEGQTIDYWRLTLQFLIVFAIAYVLIRKVEADQNDETKYKRAIKLVRMTVGCVLIGAFWNHRMIQNHDDQLRETFRQEQVRELELEKIEEEELRRPRELPKKIFSGNTILTCQVRFVGVVVEVKILMESALGLQNVLNQYDRVVMTFEDSDGFEVAAETEYLNTGTVKLIEGTEFLQLNSELIISKEQYKSITDWTVRIN